MHPVSLPLPGINIDSFSQTDKINTGRHPDKAKPFVRMWRKATGLNNKMAQLTNKSMFCRFDLRVRSEEDAIGGGKTA